MVNDAPDMGLAGLTIGVPNPQMLQEGDAMLNDIARSLVFALPDASIHLT
jgi:hypothetical protein